MTLRSQLGQTTSQTEQINEINGYKSVAWPYIAHLTFDSLVNACVSNFDLHLRHHPREERVARRTSYLEKQEHC